MRTARDTPLGIDSRISLPIEVHLDRGYYNFKFIGNLNGDNLAGIKLEILSRKSKYRRLSQR